MSRYTGAPDPEGMSTEDYPGRCVTHHHACDCREWAMRELIER